MKYSANPKNIKQPLFKLILGSIEKKEIIGILDRTDRMGGHLLLGKKNVAVLKLDDDLVVGKWWGEHTVVAFDNEKQTETLFDICRHYNFAVEDCRSMDRKLKYMEMSKEMHIKFLLKFEQEVRDMLFEDLMFCFTNMCDRYTTPGKN